MAENEVIKINNEVSKPGPKGKYETHVKPYLEEIFEWLKQGYTDCSICEQLGLHQNTWIRYREENTELSELYARARTHRNALVMNKMFQKATGEKVTLLKQKATKDGEILDLTEEMYVPPDVNAADLFLRNNDPEYKSAKSVNDIGNLTINNFQIEDWQAKRQEILQEIKKLETIATSDYKVLESDSD